VGIAYLLGLAYVVRYRRPKVEEVKTYYPDFEVAYMEDVTIEIWKDGKKETIKLPHLKISK
jgi:hypothetical protein